MEATVQEITTHINNNETFVINILASWCPDCTRRQKPNMPPFIQAMQANGTPVYEIVVQHAPYQFLSPEHEELTALFGGHGFPRTALVKAGTIIDADNVEVTSAGALAVLAEKFVQQL